MLTEFLQISVSNSKQYDLVYSNLSASVKRLQRVRFIPLLHPIPVREKCRLSSGILWIKLYVNTDQRKQSQYQQLTVHTSHAKIT